MRTIELTQGYQALVDDDDFEWVSQWLWYAHVKRRNKKEQRKSEIVYAARKELATHKHLSMAIEIAKRHNLLVHGLEIDHVDGNRLNNQKHNLRSATGSQNQANQVHRGGSSKYKGVSWNKRQKKWKACIGFNNKKHSLGMYSSEEQAALEYDLCASELFGDYARLNFPRK